MRAVTLKDVAREAQVSITTASRALAGYRDVSAASRARVEEAARRLNYTPNLFARNLVLKGTTLIGAYIDDDGLPLSEQLFFLPVICGVRDRAAELGQHVLLLSKSGGDSRPGGDVPLPPLARATNLSGLVVMGLTSDHPILGDLGAAGVPAVTIDIEPQGDRMRMVTSDNERQAKAVTEHLIDQGCTRILFVGGKPNTTVHRARESGYRAALRARGLWGSERVVLGHFSREKAMQAVLEAWREAPFDAVFAASDLMAVGAAGALAELGLRIPDDVAVAGFDDLPLARHLQPPLTTVRQDPVAMGRAAVDLLKRLSAGEEVSGRAIEVPGELVVRMSSLKTGSCKGGTAHP